jgi:hypothetical protein
MSEATDIEALAHELILAVAHFDRVGVGAAFLRVNELPDSDRDHVLARVDGLGGRALGALAIVWDVTPAEALRRLIH